MSIDAILQMKDQTSALIELDTQVNKLSNYGEDLTKLTKPQQDLLFIENLEREVNNGGFNQFYWNSSGDYAMETVAALKAVGAHKAAEILIKANSAWPNQSVPKDREERQELLENIEEQSNPVWAQCDSEFYQNPDNITELLLDYVKRNKAEFK